MTSAPTPTTSMAGATTASTVSGALDFSARYTFPVFRDDVSGWVKIDALNVLDQDELTRLRDRRLRCDQRGWNPGVGGGG